MDSDFRRPASAVKSASEQQTPVPPTDNTATSSAPALGQAALSAQVERIMGTAPDELTPSATPPSLKKPHHWLRWHFQRRTWVATTLLVLVAGGSIGFILTRVDHKPVASATPPHAIVTKAVNSVPLVSTLSGLPITDPTINSRPVTGVMIENSLPARPQSGLSAASVVFEAIAEGGITRFLALYQDKSPDNIGPIRSARPYYAQWALGFDAGYAHVGGSPEALASIRAWGVRDLDQFYNSGAYHRIGTRAAPHNMYSSLAQLNALETGKGYTSSKYTNFTRKSEAPLKTPMAKNINLAISGPLYNVHYDYNPATNSYNRSEGGAPHIDANTNAQISPKVVIALVMPYVLESDNYHSSYNTIGSGQAYIFQDGGVTIGQWTKAGNNQQFTFTDANNQPVKLNPGQTWLTALANPSNVAYSP